MVDAPPILAPAPRVAALTIEEIAHAIDPRVFERARRVRLAIGLLRAGASTREVSGAVRVQCGISRQQAYRVMQIAVDLADPGGGR